MAANLLPIIVLFLGYKMLRRLGLRLDKQFSMLWNGFMLASYLALMMTFITAYALVMNGHEKSVITVWSANHHVSMAYFDRCDADGTKLRRGQIWRFSHYYHITPSLGDDQRIIQLGNWFTDNLSSNVSLIK